MSHLTDIEIRVIGALIEKEMTTPEYYPLTLNSLTNACNQKSNRDPVVSLEETQVDEAIVSLKQRGLALQAAAAGSRVAKFRHLLYEKMHLEPNEIAILGELMLRGPQTLGELRTRASRMTELPDLGVVEEIITELMEREEPLITKLPRQPGRKEHRYCHLLAPAPEGSADEGAPQEFSVPLAVDEDRIAALEAEVAALKAEFAEFRKQFE